MKRTERRVGTRMAWACGLMVLAGSAWAERGVVVDGSNLVSVFDTTTGNVTGNVAFTSDPLLDGDCALSSDTSKVYVTQFESSRLLPIALTSGSGSAGAPIPVSNNAEAVNISADGKYAVITNGGSTAPVSVVSLTSNAEVNVQALGGTTTSDICDNGLVLTGQDIDRGSRVDSSMLDAAGGLTTGAVSSAPVIGRMLACAPGSKTFASQRGGLIRTYSVNGFALLNSRAFTGGSFSGVVAFSPSGNVLYVRDFNGTMRAYSYNATSGVIGAELWAANTEGRGTFFGVRQLAVAKDGRVYAPETGKVRVFNGSTGAEGTSVMLPTLGNTTGICFARPPAAPAATVSSTRYDAAPVTEGPGGSYTIATQLCNRAGDTLGNFSQRVNQLTNNNNLISRTGNAPSGRPGGPGATQRAPLTGGNADGQMAPSECVNDTDVLGLSNRNKFTFTVDLFGTPAP